MPAITLLERKADEEERTLNGTIAALNMLRAAAGLPPRRPSGGGNDAPGTSGDGTTVSTQIRPDSFFGKRQQTAIREFLEMRRAQGLGPAKPREIYEAILAGGYQFEAKDAETALVGLRALLRKRSAVFIKLQNGAYGLAAWYPHAKRPKAATGEDEGTGEKEMTETEAAVPDPFDKGDETAAA